MLPSNALSIIFIAQAKNFQHFEQTLFPLKKLNIEQVFYQFSIYMQQVLTLS